MVFTILIIIILIYYFNQLNADINLDGMSDRCNKIPDTDKLDKACLVELWSSVGCTAHLPEHTETWESQTKATALSDMRQWAQIIDSSHRNACYGSKWPFVQADKIYISSTVDTFAVGGIYIYDESGKYLQFGDYKNIQSSTLYYSYATAENVFDTNVMHSYPHIFHAGGSPTPWLSAEFAPTNISKIVIFNRRDCCQERMIGAKIKLYLNNAEIGHYVMTADDSRKSISGLELPLDKFTYGDNV